MRTMVIVTMAMLAIGSTPAAAQELAVSAPRAQYRALKREVRQEYRALKQVRRQRPLNPVENKRFAALKEARGQFGDAAFKRVAGHGTNALAGGMLAAELTSFFRGDSGLPRLGLVSVCSLGLSMGPGYFFHQDSRRSQARGIVDAVRGGVQVSSDLRTSARQTLLQEAQAKRDLARVVSQPSLEGAVQVERMADSLK